MNESSWKPLRQRTLNLEQNTSRECLTDSEREKCKTLLAQMLIDVLRLTCKRESGDE